MSRWKNDGRENVWGGKMTGGNSKHLWNYAFCSVLKFLVVDKRVSDLADLGPQ